MRSSLLLVTLFAIGCASDGTLTTLSDPAEVALSVGEKKTVQDLSIIFEGVPGDSRCPSDVTCAWEGDAEAVFSLSAPGERAMEAHLHTAGSQPKAVTYGRYRVSLLSVAPYPHSETKIAEDAYRATLRVEAAEASQ